MSPNHYQESQNRCSVFDKACILRSDETVKGALNLGNWAYLAWVENGRQ